MSGRFRGTLSATDVTRVRGDGSAAKANDSLEERVKAGQAKNTAYQKYKAQLHELFDGKRELPKQIKDMLATRPGAEDHGFTAEEEELQAAEPEAKKGARKKKKGVQEKAPPGTRRRVGQNGDNRAQHVAALRAATSPRESELAINAMRADGFSVPLELDLLSKALGHGDQEVVLEALEGLLKLVEGPETKGANLLKGRVKNAALMASSAEVRERCNELAQRLST